MSGWFFVTLMTEKCTQWCMHVVGSVQAESVAEAIEYARSLVGEHEGMRLEAVPEYAVRPLDKLHSWDRKSKRACMYSADEIRLKVSGWKRRCLELHVGDYSPCCGAEMLHETHAGLPLYQVKRGIKVYDMRCSKCRKKHVAKGGTC